MYKTPPHKKLGPKTCRVGDTGGESDDTGVVAAAFEQAASAKQGDGSPSAIVVTKRNGDHSDDEGGNEALMQMLPSSCRQGVLCRVPSPPGGGDARDVVVLLGSTLAGAGVFSGMDGAWFERVCACLALGPAGAGAAATAAVEAGGR